MVFSKASRLAILSSFFLTERSFYPFNTNIYGLSPGSLFTSLSQRKRLYPSRLFWMAAGPEHLQYIKNRGKNKCFMLYYDILILMTIRRKKMFFRYIQDNLGKAILPRPDGCPRQSFLLRSRIVVFTRIQA